MRILNKASNKPHLATGSELKWIMGTFLTKFFYEMEID